jgi:hypothetical protein
MKRFRFPILGLILVLSLVVFSSCKKKKPTTAEITIEDPSGVALAGATVYVNSKNNTPPGTVEDTQTSDNRGKTFHTFENEAILQVEVTKTYGSITLTGYGILRLEEGKQVDLTIRTN